MLKFAALVAATTLTHQVEAGDPLWKLFEEFKSKYEIQFESLEEDQKRFTIFKDNMNEAAALTKKAKGKARFGPTKFAHLTKQEFKKFYLGYKKPEGDALVKRKQIKKKPFPNFSDAKKASLKASSVDWRGTAASPVKDQGQCGSCWAFSATEAVESGYYKNTGVMKILAPQQTTSCDTGDYGCNGGFTTAAYDYMREAGGLELERDYPYTSGVTERSGTCKANSQKFRVQVGDTTVVSEDGENEDAMLDEIQDTPISVCVDAEPWQFYMGGVLDASTCPNQLDHCVHLVGYKGGEDNWWIVKNSWNTNWGEDGYIRLTQGENTCGIAEEATTVEASDEDASSTPQDVVEVIEGVAKGLGITMAAGCIDSGSAMIQKLDEAYQLVQQKNAVAMAKAMQIVALALKSDLPKAASACEASKDELVQLAKALAIMEHPKQFAYHVAHDLEINGVNIYNEINASVGYYHRQQWEKMGEAIGKALEMIAIGNPTKEREINV